MSEEEFLKRWSRRKQEAKVPLQAPPIPAAEARDTAITDSPETAPEPEIDLSTLPPIDSITAVTDITAFLREGIPAELSRAALRRAWGADPAIRDFVGLAENAWDFTDPNAMPGFGALQSTPEQLAAMVERVIGGAREEAGKLASELRDNAHAQPEPDREPVVSASAETLQTTIGSTPAPDEHADAGAEQVAAAQPDASDEDGDVMPVRRRTHGGALPI